MNDIFNFIVDTIRGALWIFAIFYCIPYLVRKGWRDADNQTKKVCDVCFRDIKKFNEALKKKLSKGGEE